VNDELTVGALDGDDLELPAPLVVTDPPRDDGPVTLSTSTSGVTVSMT